jgi:hypothetical protein
MMLETVLILVTQIIPYRPVLLRLMPLAPQIQTAMRETKLHHHLKSGRLLRRRAAIRRHVEP